MADALAFEDLPRIEQEPYNSHIQEIVNRHFDQMFKELIDVEGDNLDDLIIEVRTSTDGLTVRRSWGDRNKRLEGQQ